MEYTISSNPSISQPNLYASWIFIRNHKYNSNSFQVSLLPLIRTSSSQQTLSCINCSTRCWNRKLFSFSKLKTKIKKGHLETVSVCRIVPSLTNIYWEPTLQVIVEDKDKVNMRNFSLKRMYLNFPGKTKDYAWFQFKPIKKDLVWLKIFLCLHIDEAQCKIQVGRTPRTK